EKVLRNLQTVQALQFSVYEHFGVAWLGECGIGRKIGERFGLVPQIQKVPHLNAPLLEAIIRAIGNPDEMLGIMEWQAAEQVSVDFYLKVSIEIAGLKNGANPGKYPVN